MSNSSELGLQRPVNFIIFQRTVLFTLLIYVSPIRYILLIWNSSGIDILLSIYSMIFCNVLKLPFEKIGRNINDSEFHIHHLSFNFYPLNKSICICETWTQKHKESKTSSILFKCLTNNVAVNHKHIISDKHLKMKAWKFFRMFNVYLLNIVFCL